MKMLTPDVALYPTDCRDAIRMLPDNSLDSCVSDPPYALVSVVKRFGSPTAAPAKDYSGTREGATGAYMRASAGFMGETWDTGEVAMSADFWSDVWRVLKPGAFVVAFGSSRGYHRMACAIEDAGFEIRDSVLQVFNPNDPIFDFLDSLNDEQRKAFVRCLDLGSELSGPLAWLYGTGFPKSHNLSKGIDSAEDYKLQAIIRRAAVEAVENAGLVLPGSSRRDWTIGEHAPGDKWWAEFQRWLPALSDNERARVEGEILTVVCKTAGWFTQKDIYEVRAPATPQAAEWEGWGTALKPGFEPIVLARKPLSEKTVAANVLRWRTGALNIDGCRVGFENDAPNAATNPLYRKQNGYKLHTGNDANSTSWKIKKDHREQPAHTEGRWPANVVTDGSDEVVTMFPIAPGQLGRSSAMPRKSGNVYGDASGPRTDLPPRGDKGSAARFFYSAKAGKADRNGSKHPTVKPLSLMQWLCRLVTPPGGVVFDPFAGTGTTGQAAVAEGFRAVLCEREAEYIADIERRLCPVSAPPY